MLSLSLKRGLSAAHRPRLRDRWPLIACGRGRMRDRRLLPPALKSSETLGSDTAQHLRQADVTGEVFGAVFGRRPIRADLLEPAPQVVSQLERLERRHLLLPLYPEALFELLHRPPVAMGVGAEIFGSHR